MPTQRQQLVNDEIYHVVLRAVGGSVIFNDENDFYRGIFSLYEFNNKNPVNIWLRRQQRKAEKLKENIIAGSDPAIILQGLTPQGTPERDLLVEILAFCFMPNHIHLVLKQLKDNGISQFIQKVGTGYAVYFNNKYERKGHLFNRFKAIHIKTNEQLQNVFVYVHVNPLSLIEPGWKENGIKDSDKAIKFLEEEYRWSSYFDFIEKKNFPSLIIKEIFLSIMGEEFGCKEAVKNWIIYKTGLKNFSDIILE
ncbi:transposase [Patescibacteria group bacterium]|nr:transposase [Patescibacteria group bacterium]